MKVETITKKQLAEKINYVERDLVTLGLFTPDDFVKLKEEFGLFSMGEKTAHLARNEIKLILTQLPKLIREFPRIAKHQFAGIKKYYIDKKKQLKDKYPITDYTTKSSLVAAFDPKTVLEIGTWYGWGISAIKTACPDAICYTMNPIENSFANNPIEKEKIGWFYKQKGLDINQIWDDSTKFDYTSLPQIDVCYIDGNHKYDFVYSDLDNCAKIAKKAVVLDDYIPSEDSPRGDVLFWGWNNQEVVKAVDDWLEKNDKIFTHAYWIENTPVCVLTK